MSKKKHEKKKMKRREKTKIQGENRQEILLDAPDKEQRRISRLGTIVAIIAIIGSICVFLCKMTVNSLNIWAEQGIIYWYLQALFSLALSTCVIIFIDLVLCVIIDLKRYNILDSNYKQYDQKSDERYMCLLSDFRGYILMILCVLFLAIPLSGIYCEKVQKWSGIIFSFVCVAVGIILIRQWIIHTSKEEIKKILLEVGEKIAKWVVVAVISFSVSTIFVGNNKATISVFYNTDGIVEICNTSAEEYKGLDIKIYRTDKIIYQESVMKDKLLIAQEDKYVNSEIDGKRVAKGTIINNECLHWKYIFNLNKIINESGEYYVSIAVHQKGKSVKLSNSLSVENKEYIFAKNSMEKDY